VRRRFESLDTRLQVGDNILESAKTAIELVMRELDHGAEVIEAGGHLGGQSLLNSIDTLIHGDDTFGDDVDLFFQTSGDDFKVSSSFNRDFVDVSSRFYCDFVDVSSRFHRGFVNVLSRFRNLRLQAIETLTRLRGRALNELLQFFIHRNSSYLGENKKDGV